MAIIVPKFATETEEAEWWFENRELVSEEFRRAADEGRLRRGGVKRRWEELQRQRLAEQNIELDPEDAVKAHAAAERHGMAYAAYVKKLVHEALEREDAA